MRTFRSSLVLAGVFALMSCGNSGPAVLSLNGNTNTSAEDGVAGGAQDSKMMAVNVEYKAMNDLPALATSGHVYVMKRPKDFLDQFKAIAVALGQKGDVVQSADDTNGYQIGKSDTLGMWLHVTKGESTWSYFLNASSPATTISSRPCPEKEPDCAEQVKEKPKNLLSKDDAQARVLGILGTAQVDTSSIRFSASTDDWSTSVTGVRQIDGLDTSLLFSFNFGADGVLGVAHGVIVSLVKGDEYPLVSPEKAIDRLTSSMFGMETKVGIDSLVAPTAESPPIVIPITGVRLSYMAATLANGSSVLLPAFTYSNTDRDVGTVFAVEQKYLVTTWITDTGKGVIEPGQPGSGSGSSDSSGGVDVPTTYAITQSDANTLIGLTEDEAGKIAVEKGWLVRVAMRDGEAYMLTQDFVPNRVNLTLVKILVTAVAVG